VEYTVELVADSLFEAAALGLQVLPETRVPWNASE
jgi:hypothetical protein